MDNTITSLGLVSVTCRVTYVFCLISLLIVSSFLFPFSTCDTPGTSSQPHPDEEACIYDEPDFFNAPSFIGRRSAITRGRDL